MNFNIIEGDYDNFSGIYDDFEKDYLTTPIKNNALKKKYDLSERQLKELCREVKAKNGLSSRPRHRNSDVSVYRNKHSWTITKEDGYFGSIPLRCGEKVLNKAINICKKYNWDESICQEKIKELKSTQTT